MITAAEVRKVAKLAHLEIAEADVDKTAATLSAIMGHIEMLGRLDTGAVEPTSHVIAMDNVFRDDEVKRHFDGGTSLDNAPARAKGYFSVPRIIE